MTNRPRRMTGVTRDERTFILEEDPRNAFDGRPTWMARASVTDVKPYGILATDMRSRGCPDRGDRRIIADATAVEDCHQLVIPHANAWSITLERLSELPPYDDYVYGMLRTALREAMCLEPAIRRNRSLTLIEVRAVARRTLNGMGEPHEFSDVDVCDALAELGVRRGQDGRWYF